MFDKNTTGRLGLAKTKAGKQGGNRSLPGHAVFIDEFGEQEGRHGLGVRGDHEQGVAVRLLGASKFLDTEPISEDDLAVLHQAESDSGDSQHLLSLLDETGQFCDARVVETVRFFACKRLAAIAFGQQTSKNQGDLTAALLADRI